MMKLGKYKSRLTHIPYKKSKLTDPFFTRDADQINNARLEHLVSLNLGLHDKSVVELGAGVGRLTDFFIRRNNRILVTEGRPELVKVMREKFSSDDDKILGIEILDLEKSGASVARELKSRFLGANLLYQADQSSTKVNKTSREGGVRCRLLLRTSLPFEFS